MSRVPLKELSQQDKSILLQSAVVSLFCESPSEDGRGSKHQSRTSTVLAQFRATHLLPACTLVQVLSSGRPSRHTSTCRQRRRSQLSARCREMTRARCCLGGYQDPPTQRQNAAWTVSPTPQTTARDSKVLTSPHLQPHSLSMPVRQAPVPGAPRA